MKHLLNNISEEEKNRIREQHTGGMRIATDKFKMLVETKQGDVKLYLNEQPLEKNKPKPEDLIGKTVNFYEDKENQNKIIVLQQAKITGVDENETNNVFTVTPKSMGKPFELRYNCERKDFTVFSSGAPSEAPKKLYNKSLSDAAFEIYCTTNSAGKGVQKADFASTDGGDDVSNMA
jgi:hypothetical protein